MGVVGLDRRDSGSTRAGNAMIAGAVAVCSCSWRWAWQPWSTGDHVAPVAPILICYDGSDGARAALDAAVETFDRPMVVACYWQPFAESDKPLGIEPAGGDPGLGQRQRS